MAIPGNFLSATTETIDPNTSGWKAKTNCTISLASGGRAGDGVLLLTSSVSGEMQARTAASYPVVPGVTYYTFADAAVSATAERIGIRWLDSSGTELSVTWSLSTSIVSGTLHRISVAGLAPAGAVRAQVLLSTTATASGQQLYAENVYLGYPLRLPGNLLSFNAESGGEVDTSAWGVEANCTVGRAVIPVQYPVDWYYSGGHVVKLTVTAGGNASILCTERAPVTPGVDYMCYAVLYPPTTSTSVWIELRYYDADGSQIAAQRSTLAAAVAGFQAQIASMVAPAGAATASVAIGVESGTASQVVYAEEVVISVAQVPATGTVMPLADSDFEQGVGSWSVVSGSGTIARSTPWGAQAFRDYYSLTVSSTATGTTVIQSAQYPVVENENWRITTFQEVSAGGWTWTAGLVWYDADGAEISSSATSSAAVPSPGWWEQEDDFAAPAGAVTAAIQYSFTATSANSKLQLDWISLRQVLPLSQVDANDDTASIRLILRELTSGYLVTVWRVLPDGSRTLVRGPDGLLEAWPIAGDELVIEDYEAPLGVQVYYQVHITAADGLSDAEDRTSARVQLDPGDPNYVWLKCPGKPPLNLKVLVKAAPDWSLPIEQSVNRVRGRSNAVIISDVRGGREGSLVCWTETDDQREALRYLLSQGDVLLWQSAPGMGEPDVYVSVAEAAYPRIVPYAREPWREWTLPLTQVDMPTGGTAGSANWTVRDVLLENDTALGLLSRYASVWDLLIDQRQS